MKDLKVIEHDGLVTTNSITVAEVFGKTHRDVTHKIKIMNCSDEFRVRNFSQSSFISKQNKRLECVDMTKDGFTFLCMSFTTKKAAEFKEAYIARFNEMEHSLKCIPSMMALNELTAKIEGDKLCASICGKELNRYKKIKKENEELFEKSVFDVQLKLGF